ncbi:NAD(P)/FAD-dependent oxidoreductase [Nesterenkonia pannonica]|uniref:NAD(P)/FAD-dependent oxidoreductase n=1 Tax=Nesterenkonia pannonica TaxID=1548602 RepID=UPI002164506A|nr:NAD(P)/FAD-dependent oxidoreductase [Nesterenkonia pannonica]
MSTVSEADAHSMRLVLEDGQQFLARAIVAATGVADRLPEIPGLAERWGRSVLHCPYCHGWEVRGRRLGVLATGPMAMHQAQLLRQWSDDLTFFSAAAEPLEEAARLRLSARGVKIEPRRVTEVRGEGGSTTDVRLEGGGTTAVDAIFTAGALVPHDDFLEGLALARADSIVGSFLAVDETLRTSHPRVWAAGI